MKVNAKDGFFEVNQNEWVAVKNGVAYGLKFEEGEEKGSNMCGTIFKIQDFREETIQTFFKEDITCPYWLKDHWTGGLGMLQGHRRENFLIQANQYIEAKL